MENVYKQGGFSRRIARAILKYWWLLGGVSGAVVGVAAAYEAKVLIEWIRCLRKDAMWPM